MARSGEQLQMSVRVRWWVMPYMRGLQVFSSLIWRVARGDQGKIDAFIGHQADFIGRYGVHIRKVRP